MNEISIKQFKTWNQFKIFSDKLSGNWLFRGQSNASWGLKSTLERSDFFGKYDGIETTFLQDFQRGAKNFISEKEMPMDLIEWLALMQHHGAPTRLLDFTMSPYIAAYFAFEKASNHEKKVAIWAINIHIVRQRALLHFNLERNPVFEKSREGFSDEDFERTKRELTDKDFETLFYENDQSGILPVVPFRMNRRYHLQQSVFVSPANTYEKFMEQLSFLEDDIAKAVVKITLPTSLKNEVLRDLQKMNLNRASLFPDLDGYSAALKMKYNVMHSMDELLKQQHDLVTDKKFIYYP